MSATSTPHRHPRGVTVPFIDTRAPSPKKATALQCAGWLTPPQSAHESRRGSLAYSSYPNKPYPALSTTTTFSLPSTPSRIVPNHSNLVAQPFSQEQLPQDIPTTLSTCHLTQDLISLGVNSQPAYDISHDAAWQTDAAVLSGPDDYTGHFSSEQAESLWNEHSMITGEFLQQPVGLHTTLFPIGHGLDTNFHVVPQADENNSCSLIDTSVSSASFQYNTLPPAGYQSPEIVEPAFTTMVNPHDAYGDQHYQMLASPDSSPQDMSASFGSSFASFEEIQTPSPDVDFGSDIDGFVMVKGDVENSPASAADFKPCGTRSGLRKSAKRTRKTQRIQQRKNINNTGIDVELAGEGMSFDANGQICRIDHRKKSKPFVCVHEDQNGIRCDRAFARSEHLKRHMSMHSPVRLYPCVLPDCNKKIGRSDNACDHFRTHLQLKGRNKRNNHHHWRELERRIRIAYSQKRADKITANLLRWLEKECALDDELRKAHEDDRWVPDNTSPMRYAISEDEVTR